MLNGSTVKVNDILVGIKASPYVVTDSESLIQVMKVTDAEKFKGKMIGHKRPGMKEMVGTVYDDLMFKYFEVPTQAQIDEINHVKPKKEKAEKKIKLGNLVINFYPTLVESNFNAQRTIAMETEPTRLAAFNAIRDNYVKQTSIYEFRDVVDLSPFDDILNEKAKEDALKKLINFFVEFQFEPNFRFVNTLVRKAAEDVKEGLQYVNNYFSLCNSPYTQNIVEKIKSPEFTAIINNLSLVAPSKTINKRLKIYYGSQGTGKTTRAMDETGQRCVICNNSILPSDLMEDFTFNDGEPGFHKSMLCRCMEEGKTITLDEINLLPFETVRFLQGILDDKKEFIWKGETIKIKEGFGIIGTMNLIVNGMAFGLPEPLIDRCSDIRKYELTAKDLMTAIE